MVRPTTLLVLALAVLVALCVVSPAGSVEVRRRLGAEGRRVGHSLRLGGDTGDSDGDSGDGGESGESGMSEEEADAKEEENAELLNKVKEMAAAHREAQEELAQALHGNNKMTAEAKAVALKRGATADSTDSALKNSMSANDAAVKALEKSKETHKKLVEAKLAAGIALGGSSKAGKIGALICRRKLKKKEKKAIKLAKKAHEQAAKAWAASQFLKLKLQKAHALAVAAKETKSRETMDKMLDRSKKATEAAQKAREDAIKSKAEADKTQAEADDLREDAARIADECAFLLAEHNIASLGWKGVQLPKGEKNNEPASQEEEPTTDVKTPTKAVDALEADATQKLIGAAPGFGKGAEANADARPDGVDGNGIDLGAPPAAPGATQLPSETVQEEAQKLLGQEEEASPSQKSPEDPAAGALPKESVTEKVESVAERADTDAAQGKPAKVVAKKVAAK
eukprot:g3994.t1